MNERLKKLRKELGLTQEKFAERIGVKQNTVAQYEMGRNSPIESVINLICKEFDVNKNWLKDGNGEMFVTQDRYSEIAKFTKQLLREEEDSFKNRFISAVSKLTPEQWEFLEKIAENISKK